MTTIMSSQTIEALYATGHWLFAQNRHAEASEVFRVMAMSKPDDERAWLALGTCHERIGQPRLAVELYGVAASVAAPAIRCAIARGRVLRSLDEDDAARRAFETAYEEAIACGDEDLAGLALQEAVAS